MRGRVQGGDAGNLDCVHCRSEDQAPGATRDSRCRAVGRRTAGKWISFGRNIGAKTRPWGAFVPPERGSMLPATLLAGTSCPGPVWDGSAHDGRVAGFLR